MVAYRFGTVAGKQSQIQVDCCAALAPLLALEEVEVLRWAATSPDSFMKILVVSPVLLDDP